jgi:hypothetical protein
MKNKIRFSFTFLVFYFALNANGQVAAQVPRPEYVNNAIVWEKSFNMTRELELAKTNTLSKFSGTNFLPGGSLYAKNKFGFSIQGAHSNTNVSASDSTTLVVKINPDLNPKGLLFVFMMEVNEKKDRREVIIGYYKMGSMVYTDDKQIVYKLKKIDPGIFTLKFNGQLRGEFVLQIGTYSNSVGAEPPSYLTFNVN